MKTKFKNKGFSLTEVLMAAGILCIGIMLVATMFPVGIYLTTVASERTMASIVADEAFAKIQLYGIKTSIDSNNLCLRYEDIVGTFDSNESSYPSVDPTTNIRQYYWSAMCKRIDLNANDTRYLVTVFVSRKTSPTLKYPRFYSAASSRPVTVQAYVSTVTEDANKLEVKDALLEPKKSLQKLFPPAAIIDNATGQLYRVIERDEDTTITLDRKWEGTSTSPYIWFMSPPEDEKGTEIVGKNPDVEVFQRIIRF